MKTNCSCHLAYAWTHNLPVSITLYTRVITSGAIPNYIPPIQHTPDIWRVKPDINYQYYYITSLSSCHLINISFAITVLNVRSYLVRDVYHYHILVYSYLYWHLHTYTHILILILTLLSWNSSKAAIWRPLKYTYFQTLNTSHTTSYACSSKDFYLNKSLIIDWLILFDISK